MYVNVDKNTPIAVLTVGQLLEFMHPTQSNENNEVHIGPLKKYAYGLKGIRELFHVSHSTAHRYKETFLKPAIMQNGRKVVVDVEKALSLFKEKGASL